jgi:hypothetical protein
MTYKRQIYDLVRNGLGHLVQSGPSYNTVLDVWGASTLEAMYGAAAALSLAVPPIALIKKRSAPLTSGR